MAESHSGKKEAASSGTFQVVPLESPSENYLVTEHLQRMPKPISRGIIYILVLILLVALVYSLISKIDIVVESRSVVQPFSHKIKVLSDREGYIEKIFISEGQNIEKEAPLFLIRSKEALAHQTKVRDMSSSIPLKKEYFNTKIASVLDELRQLKEEHNKKLIVNKLKWEQNNLTLYTIEADLVYWEKELPDLSKEFEDVKMLFDKRLVPLGYFNSIKTRLERGRTERVKLLSQKDIQIKENKIIEEEISESQGNYQNRKRIFEKEIRKMELEKEATLKSMQSEMVMSEKILTIKEGRFSRKENQTEKGNLIQAEKAGTISELHFRNIGDYIRPSDLLCTILPSDSPLYVDITVANKDIGFIEKAMEIKYKFDHFPYADYGILRGKVFLISPSAVEDKTLDFVYHVYGTLDQPYFEIKGKQYPIKAGMTAIAGLITERKTIFSMVVKKIKEL